MSTQLSSREAYPVRIGALLLFCESFNAVRSRVFSEQSTVSSDTVFSGTNKKAMKITFEGRIYEPNNPLYFLRYADGFLNAGTSFQVEYRGVTFYDCYVQSYSCSDKGEDYIFASITLLTTEHAV